MVRTATVRSGHDISEVVNFWLLHGQDRNLHFVVHRALPIGLPADNQLQGKGVLQQKNRATTRDMGAILVCNLRNERVSEILFNCSTIIAFRSAFGHREHLPILHILPTRIRICECRSG